MQIYLTVERVFSSFSQHKAAPSYIYSYISWNHTDLQDYSSWSNEIWPDNAASHLLSSYIIHLFDAL